MDFIDLKRQQQVLKDKLDQAIARVLAHGRYINGPEVAELEEKLASFAGAGHAVAVDSGTGALELLLEALGCGSGDAVIVPSFTFAATAEAVASAGATPLFADVDPQTALLDPASVTAVIKQCSTMPDLKLRGIIGVDLFGQPADYTALSALAREYNLFLIEDAAQSIGASDNGSNAGSLAPYAITSFFPAKPLGGYGDGGMVFCNDKKTAREIRSLREHGRGEERLSYTAIGTTARLDTIQAAILLEKLKIFADELEARRRIAARYRELLPEQLLTLQQRDGTLSSWAQFTVCHPQRDKLLEALQQAKIPAAVYYRKPLHVQPVYQKVGRTPLPLPATEKLSKSVFSLPFHPYLQESEQQLIAETLQQALKKMQLQ